MAEGAIYDQTLRRARIYERASRREAAEGQPLSALIFAWGTDLSHMQTSLYEQALVGRKASLRQFFAEAQVLLAAFRLESGEGLEERSVAEMMMRAREQLLLALPSTMAMDISGRLPDVTYLSQLPSPSAEELHSGARARLQGAESGRFVAERRTQAALTMQAAVNAARGQGDVEGAIQLAYQADALASEAYLVESAETAGDSALWTVELRWELIARALDGLVELPGDFRSALAAVRAAIGEGLGDPDGARLRLTLEQLDDW